MAAKFKKSSKVSWRWLGRSIEGTVEQAFEKSVSRTIKGKKITRHSSKEKPAYLVRSAAGNLALKLEFELKPEAPQKKVKKPTIFE